jgi:para-nitrobenzyl esterase
MAGKAEAAALAGRLLAALGLADTELHRLQTLGYRDILTAAEVALQHGGVPFEPVVDGISLPENPFTPLAPEISRNVPLIIGTNRDEATLAFIHQPGFADMTAEQASARFTEMLGARGAAAFALYRDLRPHDPPGYWVTALVTDRLFRMNAITLAERKAAQGGANVYMYRLDWPTPVEGGRLRTPHTLDIPLVFDNVDIARGMVGPGPRPRRMASIMSRAWAGFAHTGNPSQPSLAWPCYDAEKRLTMIFDLPSEVSSDPGSETRRFWSG